ncbi:HAD-IC family P-type ATPase [Streptomyces sp. DH8]|uniref:HAD-IC family P-type ATPase n=1 Tax=Streptomyces sp. DH8 TaxID=2857008 RepID=UPI001E4D41CF|nr:HAD-IC family P-type ATPase [Streptomyces sp. DH8]
MTQRALDSSGGQTPGPGEHSSGTSRSPRNSPASRQAKIDAGAELDPVHPVAPPPTHRPGGLSAAEVAERVARGEVNDVPVRSSRSVTEIVRANVLTRFNLIIGVLWVIMLFVAPIQDSLFGFVIVANTGIGIIQEWRAKKTLDSLAVIGEAKPTVRRDGAAAEISTSEIVLGDLVELGPGDKVVVDGTVAEADSLEIDESLLTGEADPVVKRPGDQVMSGSFVVAGGGAFTATKVGREAYAAQLAEEASRFTLVHSELRSGISTILKYVTWMMVPTAIGLILSQLVVKDTDFKDSVARTVGGIVPMIPEGLVLLTSVAFAIGVVRLGRKQCLVQELPAIEGLARVDVVCLDKTGTLTEGGMDVSEVRPLNGGDEAYVQQVLRAFGSSDPRPNASLRAIVDAYPPDGGNAEDGGSESGTAGAGGSDGGTAGAGGAEAWTVTDALPFSSARKYSGAAFTEADGTPSAWLLGAPDVLLPEGDPALGQIEQLNEEGLRVLLLARVPGGELDAPGAAAEASPTALVVLEQRLRPDAGETLAYFADQNVAAKVISGDNAVSVGAVAGKLGMAGAENTLDARRLPGDPDEMASAMERNAVFGRVTPQQKREMVAALQSRGHTVAMTGDGVNDVLALKDADIGVSMGSGSEATRAVAQIVLLNNSFATLPSVVAEGRRVIGNITRVATLFLTKTVYSVLLAILVVCTQVEYPFLPRHLTLLSTLTIGVPAFFLALAPNKERAQPHFVRRVMRYAIPSGVLAAASTFATYLLARHHYAGAGALEAETSAATLTLFLVSMYVLAIIARPYTWWRVALVAAMGLGFLIVLVVPWLQDFFALKLVGSVMPWAAVGVAAAAAVLLEFVWRWVGRRFRA